MYGDKKWPIVYSKSYNVRFYGIEKLHPFDSSKWGNVFKRLEKLMNISEEEVFAPDEATEEELLSVHTQRYLKSLRWSWNVAKIAEVQLLACLPNALCQKHYLRPMRYQTKGTIMAGELAMERGWAINIGGGFHHCSRDRGQGFCPYADITIVVEALFRRGVRRVMIVDLDAHQGNGHERDFLDNSGVFIMDVYNSCIYPGDDAAKEAIRCKIELQSDTKDAEYLEKVEDGLERSLNSFHPDILIFNAGTDVLEGDPLGKLSISPLGVIRRDEIVFSKARERDVPILMLTSGGYTQRSPRVIASSIANLHNLDLINKYA